MQFNSKHKNRIAWENREVLNDFIYKIEIFADEIISGKFEKMNQFVEIIDGVYSIILSLNKADIEYSSIEALNNCLRDMMMSLENKDYMLIGDQLKYELVPNLSEIGRYLV